MGQGRLQGLDTCMADWHGLCVRVRVWADGVVTKQERSANFWDCSDPYVELKVTTHITLQHHAPDPGHMQR